MKEVIFEIGQMVWNPQSGWGELRSTGDKTFPLITNGNIFRGDGKKYESEQYRSIFTLEEAKALGLVPPQEKVKLLKMKLWRKPGTNNVFCTDAATKQWRYGGVDMEPIEIVGHS